MHRQAGLTLISTLILIVVALAVLTVLSRLLPTYSQHSKVVSVMKEVAASAGTNADSATIRREVFLRLKSADITAVQPRDLKVRRKRGGFLMSVRYEVPVKLYGSMGLIAKFEREIESPAK